ncbi:MAG: SEC-C metal-binding domain-containing protein [Planctomycetales bacterium]
MTLREIGDSGKEGAQPLEVALRVDLTTWEECDPPKRSLQTAEWVRQFLSDFPTARQAELKARLQSHKQTARRLAEYRIDPQEVIESLLFSYSNLVGDRGALSNGGRDYAFEFVHQDCLYLVEDLYCPNPTCDCQAVEIQFWKQANQKRDGIEKLLIVPMFLGKMSFSGEVQIVSRKDCAPDVAEAVFSAWRDRYRNQLPLLKDRYQKVKAIGQRSLDAAETPTVRRPHAVAQRTARPLDLIVPKALQDEAPARQKRVGRNEPCPCGSGKKYKKCCGGIPSTP